MRRKSFFTCLIREKKKAEENSDSLALDFLKEVWEYISKGTYSSCKKCDIMTSLFLENTIDTFIAGELGLSESTVRGHRRNLSSALYTLFGEDFFELFQNTKGNRSEILKRIYIVENLNVPMENQFVSGVLGFMRSHTSGVKSSELSGIDLASCPEEVKFIFKYCKQSFLQELQALNKEKLCYVLSVMQGTNGTYSERYSLLSKLIKKSGGS